MKKIISLLCLILIVSCSSSDDSDGNDQDNSDLSFYINADINGNAFASGIPTDISVYTDYGSSNSYQRIINNDGACIDINYEPSLYPFFDETKPGMSVGFIGFMGNANITCSDELSNFSTLFPVGSYSYAEGAYNFGAKVGYATTGDDTQEYYTSYGPQNGNASFSITNVESFTCGFKQCVILTGTFSCRVYNESDATDFIDVTDGAFKLNITSFNP